MERSELVKMINSALAEEFEIEESEITPSASIKDTLELDSLSLVDLIALMEQKTGVKIPGSDVTKILNFDALYDYIAERM
ncbi:MAG: acyl carrier protein [Bacteroidales bacterium]|jgi:acyl carrier protein|nr:acyl carrier protein [Bacteroidales bacterium]